MTCVIVEITVNQLETVFIVQFSGGSTQDLRNIMIRTVSNRFTKMLFQQ